jgi:hypothetical protein
MANGLNLNRLVRVQVNLQPLAAPRRGFGTLLIMGDSDVISGAERFRTYLSIDEVAEDFGTTAPEYLGAELYFSQVPRPDELMIGRWLRTPTSAILEGGILTPAEQTLSNWTTIVDGSFTVFIDSVETDISLLDFSLETNLNGVASVITTALAGDATMTWTGSRFILTSASTGAAATLSFLTPEGSGTDISTVLKMTSITGLAPIDGYDVETPLAAVVELANLSGLWYGITFCASVQPTDDDSVEIAGFIEAESVSRLFGVSNTDVLTLDALYTDDIASRLKALDYLRSTVQYSANKFAVCSLFGRAFSVNFNANSSTITLMYKQEPGVVAENLTNTQANTLKSKNCNVFVAYQNNTAIIQYGTMASGDYIDLIHGVDWFSDAVQNACYNLLYQSKTKIPQTDSGQNQIVNEVARVCREGVNNGLIAPGVWNADGFGQLETGDFLKSGFYIFTQPMALQPQAIREQRIAPGIQTAVKMAGAIQEIDVIIDVNR